jgi:hypothetical protein
VKPGLELHALAQFTKEGSPIGLPLAGFREQFVDLIDRGEDGTVAGATRDELTQR